MGWHNTVTLSLPNTFQSNARSRTHATGSFHIETELEYQYVRSKWCYFKVSCGKLLPCRILKIIWSTNSLYRLNLSLGVFLNLDACCLFGSHPIWVVFCQNKSCAIKLNSFVVTHTLNGKLFDIITVLSIQMNLI